MLVISFLRVVGGAGSIWGGVERVRIVRSLFCVAKLILYCKLKKLGVARSSVEDQSDPSGACNSLLSI